MEVHRGRAGSALLLSVTLLLGFVVGKAEPASAADVAVSPVNITLTRDVHSALLTVTNQGADTVRFSLSTFAWGESDAGKMELTPTTDIVFFPTLLTLAPGQGRNVRLGTQSLPGDVEKTYRIFLEELPAPQTSATGNGMQIHVLSKIGIPIFLAPDKPKTQAEIDALAMTKRALSFQIANTGTVHILPGPVTVEGMDEAGKTILDKQINVWYVLAGGTRSSTVALPTGLCARIKNVSILMKTGALIVRKSQPAPSNACAS
jgi:fimbrial chaperone protein